MSDSDEIIWQQLLALMPLHECGQRLQPGGTEGLGHALVCTPCSHVEFVDPAWVATRVDEARRRIGQAAP
jgi:hypothetical protein